jgi:hypothetical protein
MILLRLLLRYAFWIFLDCPFSSSSTFQGCQFDFAVKLFEEDTNLNEEVWLAAFGKVHANHH